MAVVHAQDGLDVGQQVTPGQALAQHLGDDRRTSQASADQYAQAQLLCLVAVELQADVMHLHRRAILLGSAQGDLELARQEQEFRVDRRPLAQDFGQRARVEVLVGSDPGEGLGGDIAHAVAGGLDGVHVVLGQPVEDVRHALQFDPVELDVLPRGEVPVAPVVFAGDMRQGAHLPCRQGAVGNRHAQHVGMLLQVQAILQAQRQELLLAQLATQAPLNLVAELGDALAHQRAVVVVVLVHAGCLLITGCRLCLPAVHRKQRQKSLKKPDQTDRGTTGNRL